MSNYNLEKKVSKQLLDLIQKLDSIDVQELSEEQIKELNLQLNTLEKFVKTLEQ
jgi:hypothetical protein